MCVRVYNTRKKMLYRVLLCLCVKKLYKYFKALLLLPCILIGCGLQGKWWSCWIITWCMSSPRRLRDIIWVWWWSYFFLLYLLVFWCGRVSKLTHSKNLTNILCLILRVTQSFVPTWSEKNPRKTRTVCVENDKTREREEWACMCSRDGERGR